MTSQEQRRRPSGLGMVLVLGWSSSCADLPDFHANQCGDAVLDVGEDCDSAAPAGSRCAAGTEEHACQFVCDSDSACPDGLVCGLDGACRKPGALFGSQLEVPGVYRRVEVGDIDGDGRTDLVTADLQGNVAVTYLSGRAVGEALSLPATDVFGLAVGMAQVDSPVETLRGPRERSDVIAGSNAALAVLLGEGSRNLIVQATSSYPFTNARIAASPSRAVAYPGSSAAIGDELRPDTEVETVFVKTEAGFLFFIKSPYTPDILGVPATQSQVAFPFDPERIIDAPTLAPMFQGRGQRCDEMVMGFHGESATSGACSSDATCGAAVVVSLCDRSGKENGMSSSASDYLMMRKVPIEPNERLRGKPYPVDVDNDGLLDLAFVVERVTANGVLTRLGVAKGNGKLDELDLQRKDDLCSTSAPDGMRSCESVAREGIIGAADLNGDKWVDWITRSGVYLSVGPSDPLNAPAYYAAGAPSGDAWAEAAAVDLNGDGDLDVVGVPPISDSTGSALVGRGIDILLASGGSYFNPSVLETTGAISHLAVGDFDGDRLFDLVAKQGFDLSESCSNIDDVVVVFGTADGIPKPPRVVGRVAGVRQIVTGRLPRLDLRDSIHDFGTLSSCTEDNQVKISVFYGSSNRLLDAPVLINDQYSGGSCTRGDEVVPYTPTAIAATNQPAHGGLRVTAALARADEVQAAISDQNAASCGSPERRPYRTELFIYQSQDSRLFVSRHAVHLPPPASADPRTFVSASQTKASIVRVANLDSDPFEEVVVFLPTAAGDSRSGVTVYVIDGWACAKTISDIAEPEIVWPGCQEQGGAMKIVQLELPTFMPLGDDRIAIADLNADGINEILLFGDRGQGSTLTQLALADGELMENILQGLTMDPLAVTIAQGTDGLTLLVAEPRTESSAALVQYAIESGKLGSKTTVSDNPFPCGSACGLRVGDFDGDGLEDLAVRSGQGHLSVLFRQRVFLGDLSDGGRGAP